MFRIEVTSGYKNYSIIIGRNSLKELNKFLQEADKILVITDENVYGFHGNKLISLLKKYEHYFIIQKPGEKSKSLTSVTHILNILKKENFTKSSLIISFGGGVVGDIAGFAASIYMRGINLVQIPTTLLSCVDSSVGGKTGIDFKGIKNLVGSFYNPSVVIIEPEFLKTLPAEEFNCGLGEVIKYKFLIGGDFYNDKLNFNNLETFNNQILSVIKECLLFKSSVVSLDERDNGIRKILNLGHTFAHAYESSSGYKIKHGQAVALGLVSSFHLSYLYNFISKEQLMNYLKLPDSILPVKRSNLININKAVDALLLDKKVKKGKVTFILIKSPGEILTDFEAVEAKIYAAIKSTFSF